MAGGNQEDGPYVPVIDPDESDPQTPDTPTTKKTPPPKSPRRQLSLRTKSPPKTPQGPPPTPNTPKKSPKKIVEQTPVAGPSKTASPKTPGGPKSPKSPKKGASSSPIVIGSPPKPTAATVPKKARAKNLTGNVDTLVESLPEIPKVDANDQNWWLCERRDAYWNDNARGVNKYQLTAAIKYYIRPSDKYKSRLSLSTRNKPVLLKGLKQIYFDRDDASRWTVAQLESFPRIKPGEDDSEADTDHGISGEDYEAAHPKAGGQGSTKGKEKAVDDDDDDDDDDDRGTPTRPKPKGQGSIKGKERAIDNEDETGTPVGPTPKGLGSTKRKKRAIDDDDNHHHEEKPLFKRPKPFETTQYQQEGADQGRGADLRSEQLDERSRRFVEETIRQTLSTITYHDLSRHPSAYSREPVPAGTVRSREDFGRVIPAAFSANADIQLVFRPNDRWNPEWEFFEHEHYTTSFPLRGRGPVWSDNSCAIDSCIVAGMLLDAGSTIADRKDASTVFTPSEDAFLEIIEKNWSVMSKNQSIAERHNFWKILHVEARKAREAKGGRAEDQKRDIDAWQVGVMQAAAKIWRVCTSQFQQFQFKYFVKRGECSGCGEEGARSGFVTANLVSTATFLPASELSPDCKDETARRTLHDSLQTFFTSSKRCRKCTTGMRTTEKVVVGEPPLRLVVTTHTTCAITQHTNNVRLQICTVDPDQWPADAGQNDLRPDPCTSKKTIEYRWLGGIYYHEGHFRVYWTDNDRTEPDQGNFKVYDGMNAEGAIVGGVRAAHETERIHPDWANTGAQTILFYERVLAPTAEVLEVAAETIKRAQGGASLVSAAPLLGLRAIAQASGGKNLSKTIVKNGLFSPITPGNFQQRGSSAGQPIELDDSPSPSGSAPQPPPRQSEVLETQPRLADVTIDQPPPPATSEANPIINTVVLYPALTIEPPIVFHPDDFDPRIQHAPEPTHEEMFPGKNPFHVQPRVRRAPTEAIPMICNECGLSVLNKEFLEFEDPEGTMLYIHDACYQCRRCGARLNGLGPGVEINRNEIAVWHGPVPEFDGEALCQFCGEYLDMLEERAKRNAAEIEEEKAAQGDEMDIEPTPPPPPPTRVMTSGWTPINRPTTIGEVALLDAGGDEPMQIEIEVEGEVEEEEEVDEEAEAEWERLEEERKAKRREMDKKRRDEKKRLKASGLSDAEIKKRMQELAKQNQQQRVAEAKAQKAAEAKRKKGKKKAKVEQKKEKEGEQKQLPQTDESEGESEGEGDSLDDDEEESEDSGAESDDEDDEEGGFIVPDEDDAEEGEDYGGEPAADTEEEGEEEDEEHGEGDDNDDDVDEDMTEDDDDDAPENEQVEVPDNLPEESSEEPMPDCGNTHDNFVEDSEQPEDDLENDLMLELQNKLETPHEPGERSADWRDWTQDIVSEPTVEEDPEPKCLICNQDMDLDQSPMSASDYLKAVGNGDDLDGQYIIRFDEVSGEKVYIHVPCWICAHCDDGTSVFSARVREGKIRCGVRAHDDQKNKADVPESGPLHSQWKKGFARGSETEEEKGEPEGDEKEESQWIEAELARQRAEWFKQDKAEKSHLLSLNISTGAKEPDMEAALGDEASKLPPPMGMDLPEETERVFEIAGLDARGYIPYTPKTASLKRKMSMDSLFGNGGDDNVETSVTGDASEPKEEGGPSSAKKLKSETIEDSLFG